MKDTEGEGGGGGGAKISKSEKDQVGRLSLKTFGGCCGVMVFY